MITFLVRQIGRPDEDDHEGIFCLGAIKCPLTTFPAATTICTWPSQPVPALLLHTASPALALPTLHSLGAHRRSADTLCLVTQPLLSTVLRSAVVFGSQDTRTCVLSAPACAPPCTLASRVFSHWPFVSPFPAAVDCVVCPSRSVVGSLTARGEGWMARSHLTGMTEEMRETPSSTKPPRSCAPPPPVAAAAAASPNTATAALYDGIVPTPTHPPFPSSPCSPADAQSLPGISGRQYAAQEGKRRHRGDSAGSLASAATSSSRDYGARSVEQHTPFEELPASSAEAAALQRPPSAAKPPAPPSSRARRALASKGRAVVGIGHAAKDILVDLVVEMAVAVTECVGSTWHCSVDLVTHGPRRWVRQNAMLVFMMVYVLLYMTVGIIFYQQHEGWSLSECVYFTVVVISTVGYGDLAPTSDASKIFTAFYVIFGASLLTFIIGVNARQSSLLNAERANFMRLESMLAITAPSESAGQSRPSSVHVTATVGSRNADDTAETDASSIRASSVMAAAAHTTSQVSVPDTVGSVATDEPLSFSPPSTTVVSPSSAVPRGATEEDNAGLSPTMSSSLHRSASPYASRHATSADPNRANTTRPASVQHLATSEDGDDAEEQAEADRHGSTHSVSGKEHNRNDPRALKRHVTVSRIEYRRWLPQSMRFIIKATSVLGILVACGTGFAIHELGFSGVDAFYWSVITGFSVGFGDLVPTTDGEGKPTGNVALWFSIFYIIAFILFMLKSLGWIADWLARRSTSRELHEMLSVNLSRNLLQLVDVNHVSQILRNRLGPLSLSMHARFSRYYPGNTHASPATARVSLEMIKRLSESVWAKAGRTPRM